MKYEVIYSKRKTISIEVKKDLKVIVRVPLKTKKEIIENTVLKNSGWIEKNLEKMRTKIENNIGRDFTEKEIEILKKKAEYILKLKTERYSNILGLFPAKIRISKAKTIWGSCSYKNSISFSYRVVLLEDELIDYIVLHELAHIQIKNHSSEFYLYIEQYMPDYKNRIKKLKNVNII